MPVKLLRDEYIRIDDIKLSGIGVKFQTCGDSMPILRGRQFPICDECINKLRRLVNNVSIWVPNSKGGEPNCRR